MEGMTIGRLSGAPRLSREEVRERAHERRRIARALMDPGASHAAVSAALAGRLAKRDAAAVEHLLQSLSPKGER